DCQETSRAVPKAYRGGFLPMEKRFCKALRRPLYCGWQRSWPLLLQGRGFMLKDVISVLLVVTLLTGCATMSDEAQTKGQGTAVGAGAGAALGAGLGYLLGGKKGALIGAGAGAALG